MQLWGWLWYDEGMFHHWLLLIHEGGTASAWVGFVLLIAVNFIPVIPIPVIAAALGAVFPFWIALVVAWSGASLGALFKFGLERVFLQKHALRWLRHFSMAAPLLVFLERNGFLAVLITRLIPVFPSSIVNLAGAVARIPSSTFIWATLIGKFPTMAAFTLAGNQAGQHPWLTGVWIVLYSVILWLVAVRLRRELRTGKRPTAEVVKRKDNT